jgi:hypothetical protein
MAHPADAMNNLLEFCGFADPAERQAIQLDSFDELDELANLEMKDIDKMTEGFSARTVANGKIVFGMRRTHHEVEACSPLDSGLRQSQS